MKIYNYIYTPILGTGYRNFTDAPPPMIGVINEFIAGKLHTKPSVQYHILTTQDHLPESFLRDNFVLVMTKFSDQTDERGRQGLQYYHIVVINQPSKELIQFVENDPKEIFASTYGSLPENRIDEFLRLARVESLVNSDELFKRYFITEQAFASTFSSSETSGSASNRSAASDSNVVTSNEALRLHSSIEDSSRRIRIPKRRTSPSSHGEYAAYSLNSQRGHDSLLRIISFISLMLILAVAGAVTFCMQLLQQQKMQLQTIASQTQDSRDTLRKISHSLDNFRSPNDIGKLSEQLNNITVSLKRTEENLAGKSDDIRLEFRPLKESLEKFRSEINRSIDTQLVKPQNRPTLITPSGSGPAAQPRSTSSLSSGNPTSVSNSR